MSIAHRPGRRLPIAAAWPVPSSPAGDPWAVISAGLAPILLTAAYLMAGILQPSSYSPVRTTISAMAGQAGTDRWVMTGGIFLVGCCYLVTAAGLTGIRMSAAPCLAVAGMAGIGIAASPNPPAARPRVTSPGPYSARSRSPCGPRSPPGAPLPRPLILSVYGSAAAPSSSWPSSAGCSPKPAAGASWAWPSG